MQLERPFFFLHLMENHLTSGIRSLRAASSGELVQYQVGASSQRFHFSNRDASTRSFPSRRAVDCVNFVLPTRKEVRFFWFYALVDLNVAKGAKMIPCKEEEARGRMWRGQRSESLEHHWPPSLWMATCFKAALEYTPFTGHTPVTHTLINLMVLGCGRERQHLQTPQWGTGRTCKAFFGFHPR